MRLTAVAWSIWAALKSIYFGGSPFAGVTALFPTNEEGKYVIQAEGIRLAFTNHGAAISNVWVNDTFGNEIDLVLGFDHADDYLNYPGNPYLGGVIGRYANVISGAGFDLQGVHYNISANYNNGTDTFNGGHQGWGRTSIDIAAYTANSITFVMFDRGKNGFPGTAASSLTHTVLPGEWRIAFGVTPTRSGSPINLSQQIFWNLNGLRTHHDANHTVRNHALHMPFSGMRLEVDSLKVPTGRINGNKKNGMYDFWSSPHCIGSNIDKQEDEEPSVSYDTTFLVNRPRSIGLQDHPVAVLESSSSGVSVEMFTDQEALHLVTWNGSEQVRFKSSQGTGHVPRLGGISIQGQDWTDAINHPEWQREHKVVWDTHQLYTSYTRFKFSTKRRV